MAYGTSDELDSRYGSTNVSAWADMEGLGTTNSDIATRITASLAWATAYIDGKLTDTDLQFSVPITATVPTLIKTACLQLAAYDLSTARGVHDYDDEGNPITRLYVEYLKARDVLEQIRAKTMRVTI